MANFKVNSANVKYTEEHIESTVPYATTDVTPNDDGSFVVTPKTEEFTFRTERKVPKLGLMLVGLGGNNGTTVVGSILANKKGITWRNKEGVQTPNYFGSVTQASTVRLGTGPNGDVFVPFKSLVPMVEPNDIVIDGWDISGMHMGDAMNRAQVFEYDLQRQLYPLMKDMVPRPSVYFPDFVAANQAERADNVLKGTHREQLEQVRKDIRDFKESSGVDTVVVLWTANTERFCDVQAGVHDSAENVLAAIDACHEEISPSTLFAVASVLEGVTYLNGSPQNTLVPGVIELAQQLGVFVGGDDFKSGQTKIKSVLVDFLVGAGIKPTSIVSYNHLGNNDGRNLSAPKTFRSKEISKRGVVDDMVASNEVLYAPGEHPDHVVVIKYVPYVGDSKRAMDEYTSEIFMGGKNTIVMHNTCEDSLLASPIIIDLAILAEMCQRIQFKKQGEAEFTKFHSILSILSYLLKAPQVPEGSEVVNALFRQRATIENIFRACVGLAPENHMTLHERAAVNLPVTANVAKARDAPISTAASGVTA